MNITLHEGQSEIFEDLFISRTVRNAVACASRGFGKSVLGATAGVNAVFELLELDWSVPNKNVYIIAPTYSQVVDIYHPLIAYQLGMDAYCKHSRDSGTFWFPNDVTLRLISYEAIERLRGTGAYFIVNDEVRDWKKGVGLKGAWQGILQPCLTTRWSAARAREYNAKSPGRSLTISTPAGYDFFYDMYNFQEVDKDWKSYHFDYTKSPYLDIEEIDKIKHTIDPLQWAREYLASFEDSGNQVFYCFDRKVHVQKDIEDFYPPVGNERGEDIHIAIDFNVGIQCSSAWALRGKQLQCIEEFKGHPDTETLANVIANKYKGHNIYAYPDPSGKARKTSAAVGRTDFSILQSRGIKVLARNKAPAIVDSVNCVNRRLKSAAGDVDMFVHPRCTGVIQSLERTSWVDNNPDLAVINKKEGVEHFSDGVRYITEYLFPIRGGTKTAARGFGF